MNEPSATADKCGRCSRILPVDSFHLDKRRKTGRYPWCKDCRRTYVGAAPRRVRTKTKPEYDRDYRAAMGAAERTDRQRRRYLWSTYRMTPEEYDTLLAKQGGCCAICGARTNVPSKYGRLSAFAVDHDHACCPGDRSCGSCVRGLLCGACNTGIGLLGDDVVTLAAALAYLAREGGE